MLCTSWKMWRALQPLVLNSNVRKVAVRQLQTLHKECILRKQPWLLESWVLLRRIPQLVESSASFCSERTGNEKSTEKPEMETVEKIKEIDVKRLFQTNPKLQDEIIQQMIKEYKYYDKNTMLETSEVKEHYLLRDRDLETLKKFRRKTPYSSREVKGIKFIYLYYKHEVEKLALKKFGSMETIRKLRESRAAEDKKYSVRMKRFLAGAKKALTGKEMKSTGGVVLFAFTVNLCIFGCKLIIYLKTASPVVFAETVHSFVDLLNQFILLSGQVISKYPPNDKFPYGHRNYLYISSLGSGGFIFAFGCVTTLVSGILKGIFMPPEVVTFNTFFLSLKILGACGAAEFFSLMFALNKYFADAKASGISLYKCVKEGDDPLTKVVIMEDCASVLGTIICACAMSAQYGLGLVGGYPVYDLTGSVLITLMLGYVSKQLLMANSEKLVGKSLWYEDSIKAEIERYRYVNGVFDIKSLDQDEDSRFKAEVELDAKEIARVIFATSADQDELLKMMQKLTEAEAAQFLLENYSQKFYYDIVNFIDDLEEDLKKKFPEVRHIDIELSGGELPEDRKASAGGAKK